MRHYLTFQDETSDKFWQIDTEGNTFTVVFGRRGTKGQSQKKSFDSAERCEKEAMKLIAEKRKKGYQEEGYDNDSLPKLQNIEEANDIKEILAEYDTLILDRRFNTLFPFLQKLQKKHYEPLKKHIKKAKKYWLDYVELENRGALGNSWGQRGDEKQRHIIVWSAIATFNKDEIKTWDEPFWVLQLTLSDDEEAILLWTKPTWIGDYLIDKALKNTWMNPQYKTWRKLESLGLLTYHLQLGAMSLGNHNVYQSETKNAQSFIDFIVNDDVAIQRDIPQLFEYETNIHNCYGNDENYRWGGTSIWEAIFRILLSEGKIDRRWFIESCLRVQTKEWNNGAKSFFRKCIDNAQPTIDELVDLQGVVFPLLHVSYNQVVNYGVSLIKSCFAAREFDTRAFIEWSTPVFMRDDCKSSIKTLLSIFEKIVKHQPAYRDVIMETAADVFVINDLDLQTKALRLLQKYARQDHEILQEKLLLYAPQLLGNIADSLSGLIAYTPSDEGDFLTEKYEFEAVSHPALRSENEVQIPDNWNDILFHLGTFIQSADSLSDEILIAIFIQKRHLFPPDYSEQCKPYLKKLEKTFYQSLFKNLTAEFLKSQILLSNNKLSKPNYFDWYSNQTIKLHLDRLLYVERQITRGIILPLLSTPTHAPCWVAPQALIERIIAYENAKEEINIIDLAIAIARMPREQTHRAIERCSQINNQKLQDLMLFCLGAHNEILFSKKSKWKLLSFGAKWLSSNEDEYTFLWALAARTYCPNEVFEEFNDTSLAGIPYVVRPLPITPQIKERWSEWQNHEGKLVRSDSSWCLELALPQVNSIHPVLLYSHNTVNKKKNWYHSFYFQKDDAVILSTLIPQNVEPIYVNILTTTFDTSTTGSSVIEGGLSIMLSERMSFGEASLLFLACACLHQKREYRGLAAEVMIFHFEQQRIKPSELGAVLGFLLQYNYAPVARLVDVLNLVKDVSFRHNLALVLLLDEMLVVFESSNSLPINFKKLLEIHLDILVKTRQKPSGKLTHNLEKWAQVNSLKSIVKQLGA